MKPMTFDEIQLAVSADHISRKLNAFSEWLDTPEEEIPESSYCFYQAVIANNKINEEDPVVAEKKETRNHRNRYNINKDAKADAMKKARCSLKGGYTPIYRGENGETKVNFISTSEWLSEGEKAFWKHVRAAKKTGNRQRFDWKKAENRKNRHNGKHICRQDVDMFDFEDEYYWYLDELYYFDDVCEDDYDEVGNPWGYTTKEKSEYLPYIRHGDFSDDRLNYIVLMDKIFGNRS